MVHGILFRTITIAKSFYITLLVFVYVAIPCRGKQLCLKSAEIGRGAVRYHEFIDLVKYEIYLHIKRLEKYGLI